MECKEKFFYLGFIYSSKVIDTLWNVKSFLLLHHQSLTGKVIDTLWKVNIIDKTMRDTYLSNHSYIMEF